MLKVFAKIFRKNKKRGFSESSLKKIDVVRGRRKVFVFNDTRADKHFGCDCVMANLACLLDYHNMSPRYYYAVGKNWEQDERVPAAVSECDVVIVNGEGSIHHSNRRARSLSRVGKFAKSLGKPVVLLNATLFENDQDIYDHLAFFDFICGRDIYSQKEAKAHGIDISYAPDLTFYSSFEGRPEKRGDGSLRILVGDSVIQESREALNCFAQKHGAERIEILHKKDSPPPVSEHVDRMSEFDLVVTGRFHTACFCLNAGIPFVAVESNTNKIGSLLEDCLNSQERLVCLDELASLDVSKFAFFSEREVEAVLSFKQHARQSYMGVHERISLLS